MCSDHVTAVSTQLAFTGENGPNIPERNLTISPSPNSRVYLCSESLGQDRGGFVNIVTG